MISQPISAGTFDASESDAAPLHSRIRSLVKDAIESLEFPPGSRLPDERSLSELYGVSRITVRRALEGLASDGLIRRRRGRARGTVVAETPRRVSHKLVGSFDALFVGSQVERVDVLAFDMRKASVDVAGKLQRPVGSSVRYIERVLYAAGAPIAHVRNFLPSPVGDDLNESEFKTKMLQEILASRHNIRLAEVQDDIDATLADYKYARLLELPLGRPLLSLQRVFIGPRRTPINLTFLSIASDRYKMKQNLRSGAG